MQVINLFGGPGVGKSVTAGSLFVRMKCMGLKVELVTEYAKDMVYERRPEILQDQIYLFAKQNRRLSRLIGGGIDYAITDSPILLGLLYLRESWPHVREFESLALSVFESYENRNYVIRRNAGLTYDPVGRVQGSVSEAMALDAKLDALLHRLGLPFTNVMASADAEPKILQSLMGWMSP